MPPLGSTPLVRFADLYAANADPWGTATREYECRKREVVMACLPRGRYRRALDVGCGTGLLTAKLAGRCDEVVAFDGVAAAVGATRAATAGLGNVRVELARLPDQVPPGPFDLVVFSEVLYYLDSADLALALATIESRLDRGQTFWRSTGAQQLMTPRVMPIAPTISYWHMRIGKWSSSIASQNSFFMF